MLQRITRLSIATLVCFSCFSFLYAADTPADLSIVGTKVVNMQANDTRLPSGVPEQKGAVWMMLSMIFEASGKIGNYYIKALDASNRTSSSGKILRWTGGATGNFVDSLILDDGAQVTTNAIFNPNAGIQVDGKNIIAWDGTQVSAQTSLAGRYGYFEGRNSAEVRGFYLGWWNGGSTVDFNLDNASLLNITGGNVATEYLWVWPNALSYIDSWKFVVSDTSNPSMVILSQSAGLRGLWTTVDDSAGVVSLESSFNTWGAYPLTFGIGWVGEIARISNTGNVGIGTTTPQAKLDVAGAASINKDALWVAYFHDGGTSTYFTIYTKIPWIGGSGYPAQVRVRGYGYGASDVDTTISWYEYSSSFYGPGSVTKFHSAIGKRAPSRVRLWVWNDAGTNRIAIEYANDGAYWTSYSVDLYRHAGLPTNVISGWTTATGAFPWAVTNITTVPQAGAVVQTSTGSVGIANINPSQALDVTGNIKASGDLMASRICTSGGTGCVNIPFSAASIDGGGTANYTARFTDADTLGIGVIQDNGNKVAIGSAPSGAYRLSVTSTGTADTMQLISTAASGQANLTLNGGVSGLGQIQNNVGDFFLTNSSTVGNLILRTNNTERMKIDSTGNVGIGTTTPQAKLEVSGQIAGWFGAMTTAGALDWNHVSNARSGNGYTLLLGSAMNGPALWAGNYYHPFSFEYNNKDGSGNMTQFAIPYHVAWQDIGMFFRTRFSGTWSTWSKVLSENTAGNVGIGNTAPTQKLDVNGNVRVTGRTLLHSVDPTIVFQDTDQRSAMVHVNSSQFYILRGSGNDSTTWQQFAGRWPLQIDLESNYASFGGTVDGRSTTTTGAGVIGYNSDATKYGILWYGANYSFYGNADAYIGGKTGIGVFPGSATLTLTANSTTAFNVSDTTSALEIVGTSSQTPAISFHRGWAYAFKIGQDLSGNFAIGWRSKPTASQLILTPAGNLAITGWVKTSCVWNCF
jgi:hypothetical protein